MNFLSTLFSINRKICFRINKFIALFWSLYHKAGYPLSSFFGCNALLMIFRGDVFRYVILPSSSYLMFILQELHLAYSSSLWLLAYSRYERIYNVSPKFAWTLQLYFFFCFYLPLLATLADRRVVKNSQWGAVLRVWGRSSQRSKILHFFAKITKF